MLISFDKKKMVEAIMGGLQNAKDRVRSENTLTANWRRIGKWDYMFSSIVDVIRGQDNFKYCIWDRGIFDVVLLYDKETKTIYSFLKRENFNKIMKRRKIKKAHYLDALLTYNKEYQDSQLQISMVESEPFITDEVELQAQHLRKELESMLQNNEINQYITIVLDYKGFSLQHVTSYICTKYLKVVDFEDWSEYITPSYSSAEVVDDQVYEVDNDIKNKIRIKPHVQPETDIS